MGLASVVGKVGEALVEKSGKTAVPKEMAQQMADKATSRQELRALSGGAQMDPNSLGKGKAISAGMEKAGQKNMVWRATKGIGKGVGMVAGAGLSGLGGLVGGAMRGGSAIMRSTGAGRGLTKLLTAGGILALATEVFKVLGDLTDPTNHQHQAAQSTSQQLDQLAQRQGDNGANATVQKSDQADQGVEV